MTVPLGITMALFAGGGCSSESHDEPTGAVTQAVDECYDDDDCFRYKCEIEPVYGNWCQTYCLGTQPIRPPLSSRCLLLGIGAHLCRRARIPVGRSRDVLSVRVRRPVPFRVLRRRRLFAAMDLRDQSGRERLRLSSTGRAHETGARGQGRRSARRTPEERDFDGALGAGGRMC